MVFVYRAQFLVDNEVNSIYVVDDGNGGVNENIFGGS